MGKTAQAFDSVTARVHDLEQKFANFKPMGSHGPRADTWGSQLAKSDRLKSFMADGYRGSCRIPIKAELTTPSGIEQRDLVAPQRDEIAGLGRQALTIRDLLTVVPTSSNLVQYVRQTSRTNAAAPVEDAALKPESDIEIELAESPIRTIAHFQVAPRQSLEDLQGLQALVDGELRYGLGLEEESQLLAGDGTGQNLLGIIPHVRAPCGRMLQG